MNQFKKYDSLTINRTLLKGEEILEYCNSSSIENIRKIGDFIKDWFNGNSKIKIQTSGSTGEPKIIEIDKDQMLQSAAATAKAFNFQEGQTALLALPMAYIAGKMMVVRALYSRLNLHCIEPNTKPIAELPNDLNIDFAPFTPMQIEDVEDSKSIKTILLGGGPIGLILSKQIQKLKTTVYHGYGMTETLSHVALRRINGSEKSAIYTALKGVTFETDNRDCLIIHVPFLKEAVVTNDVVCLKDKTHFTWKGRADNAVNSGGIKLFPETIEEKIAPFIKEPFFLYGIKDDSLGEKLCIFIESSPYPSEQFNLLKTALHKVLSKFEIPKMFYFSEKFAYTTSGKIIRKEVIKALSLQ